VLGIGPGNWSVRYPAVAPARDPSMASDGSTANPWPSSDWVAFASERGLLGIGTLGTVFVLLLVRAHCLVWRAASAEERLRGGALGAVLAATATAGAFDAVLLLAAPTFLAWTAAGALAGASSGDQRAGDEPGGVWRGALGAGVAGRARAARPVARLALTAALLAAAAIGAARGVAMGLVGSGSPWAIGVAARIAPGDYRIQLRAAHAAQRAGRCDDARRLATAARRLAPTTVAPGRILRACGGRESPARR
jgi:hypothetical protein